MEKHPDANGIFGGVGSESRQDFRNRNAAETLGEFRAAYESQTR
jgi:hypothetical protein